MKLKHLILFLLVCVFANKSFSQKKEIPRLANFDKPLVRYGYYLGLHYKGYAIKGSEKASIEQGAGFQLGVLADLNLSRYISVIAEPGVISTTNKLILGEDATEEFQIPTTHFHFPISLKFRTDRINNVRTFVQTGISYNYNFTSEKNKGDNGANPNDFLLTKHNFMAELAIGANFYFEYFKFSPSIRGIYGLNNEIDPLGSNIKDNVSSLKSRGIFLSLIFQ